MNCACGTTPHQSWCPAVDPREALKAAETDYLDAVTGYAVHTARWTSLLHELALAQIKGDRDTVVVAWDNAEMSRAVAEEAGRVLASARDTWRMWAARVIRLERGE